MLQHKSPASSRTKTSQTQYKMPQMQQQNKLHPPSNRQITTRHRTQTQSNSSEHTAQSEEWKGSTTRHTRQIRAYKQTKSEQNRSKFKKYCDNNEQEHQTEHRCVGATNYVRKSGRQTQRGQRMQSTVTSRQRASIARMKTKLRHRKHTKPTTQAGERAAQEEQGEQYNTNEHKKSPQNKQQYLRQTPTRHQFTTTRKPENDDTTEITTQQHTHYLLCVAVQ